MYFNRVVALLGDIVLSACSQVAWGKDSPSTPDYVEGELSTACDAGGRMLLPLASVAIIGIAAAGISRGLFGWP